MSTPIIGFAGLTHLGLCSAAAAASKGFQVVGWHDDADLVKAIDHGELPINEPGLEELIAACRDRLSFSANVDALASCDVVYVAFDVPTDDQGLSDLAPIEAILDDVTPALKPDATLVILCQVPPGFTRSHAQAHPSLFYQVETLVFGRAVERATGPERIIIGCDDAAAPLPPSYRSFLESFGCPLLPMGYESAELCKIAINCFLVASVTTTNALAELCEGLGAAWGEIAPALRLDRRIGPHAYLNPGLGISGGNLERDLETVVRLAQRSGADAGVIEEYQRYSGYAKDWPRRMLEAVFADGVAGRRIAVLGLAYKEDTHSTKNSPALKLLAGLDNASAAVYDPVVNADIAAGAERCESAMEALRGADAVCLMTPWAEFRAIDPAQAARCMKGRLVIDPYGLWDSAQTARLGLQHMIRGRPAATGSQDG